MELRQLRYLVLLAEELSFTRAAERARIAQPALSRQIRRLEDELGMALVDRTSRRVTMTPAGEALTRRAERALVELDEAREEIIHAGQVVSGRVTLGVTTTPGPLNIAEILVAFHHRHGAVDLRVHEDLSTHLTRQLRSDDLDLAVVSAIPEPDRSGLALELLASEPLVAVLPLQHRLAADGIVGLRDLTDETLILFPHPATIRQTIERIFARAGVRPLVRFETNDITRMRELVSGGLGVAFLPISDAMRDGPRVATVVLRGVTAEYELFLATRAQRRLAPAVRAMKTMVTSVVDAQARQSPADAGDDV